MYNIYCGVNRIIYMRGMCMVAAVGPFLPVQFDLGVTKSPILIIPRHFKILYLHFAIKPIAQPR